MQSLRSHQSKNQDDLVGWEIYLVNSSYIKVISTGASVVEKDMQYSPDGHDILIFRTDNLCQPSS